jgi:hypothetical protein
MRARIRFVSQLAETHEQSVNCRLHEVGAMASFDSLKFYI